MNTLWNAADRETLLGRLGELPVSARPKWGKLDAPRMLTHVTDALRSALGEVKPTVKGSPLQYWPVNTLVMFYLPWPKGVPTAPELLERKPLDWESEMATLRGAMTRFAASDQRGPWPRHVAFGKISGSQWGRLMYRHIDYHLGQFGG